MTTFYTFRDLNDGLPALTFFLEPCARLHHSNFLLEVLELNLLLVSSLKFFCLV